MELLTPDEMGRADAFTIANGVPGAVLMERAGLAVARVAAQASGVGSRVLVLCGPGNNGGDGFVAARLLAGTGYRVRLALLGARDKLRGDAAIMAGRWDGPVEPAAGASFEDVDLVVDALFGAGLARDLDGEARALVERVNESGLPVLAVDLPSGIDGATGAVRGAAIRARWSVTFFRPKPGHLLLPGRLHGGALTVAEIGINPAVLDEIKPRAFEDVPALWERHFPVPRTDGHKYMRGHLVAVSGPAQATGATRLTARAALRAGAGLVTVACPAPALPIHAANLSAIMVRPVDDAADLARLLADRRLTTLVIGPGVGVGQGARDRLVACADRRLVLDADLITSFKGDVDTLAGLIKGSPAAIATPHDGEFARLFDGCPDILGAPSKLERARAGAARLGAVIVLKGPDTVIAAPDGRAAIAANAPPWLATAGAGDVLAGIAGGLLAQGMPAFEAAAGAVWLHGEAAQEAGPGLVADDLVDALRPVYRRLFARLGAPV
ncbi:carbohydrate kinase, YjeF related protein [Ancylobacter novellus DSM 506]|uniref:Bifunctional NAD(P)H-hydrate repair enzyme n=1 Tax=Ancylobacter novellus (strain ATCC 8093 / DSM 506 / JCM 20403 / CCM 1077 / IAM 12100 / NBRC 12443 / NCIMB 10456) TaxID=639283 RepID=D7A1F8_ANCN5|nr:NAD(P)H-hydrate dehydratase [Ancylobacter novellus]ADH89516.1 carbohydrate kinase, YjeF related protein [Ancylobacter novellus DSM 506]